MSGNRFGKLLTLTTFGESHGKAIGGVLDGCPAGLKIDQDFIQSELNKRRPGSTSLGTSRREEDEVELLSGIFDGTSTGTSIGFIIYNKDIKSSDYEKLRDVYRPSHADFTYQTKYGIRDHLGGGRSSARETACRVVGGAIAKLLLQKHGIKVNAYVSSVGELSLKKTYRELDLNLTFKSEICCPDPHMETFMKNKIEKVRKSGDSIGGMITCVAENVPPGLGEPVFDKLHSTLGRAVLSINAVKGIEFGSGFAASAMLGSQHNDEMVSKKGRVSFKTNRSGGIQGGISNGEDIYFRAAFKPVASISGSQQTVDKSGKEVKLKIEGRHDPCVLPRAVVIVESMTALVLADFFLLTKTNRI